jgi:hypothetical protein
MYIKNNTLSICKKSTWFMLKNSSRLWKQCEKKYPLNAALNFLGNSTGCFSSNGNLLTILIPVKYAPFWYIVNEQKGKWRLSLCLVLIICLPKVVVKSFLFLLTNNKVETIYWDFNGKIPSCLKRFLHDILLSLHYPIHFLQTDIDFPAISSYQHSLVVHYIIVLCASGCGSQ